ncbi:heat-inducible transcriptional repressor HrcA, partial [Burkholderia multivorans]
GYRMFVDRIDEFKPLSAAERRAIIQLVEGESDLDGMLDRTVRLLAGLTHQVALIQYPMVSQARVKHIEVVGLAAGRILVVLITDAGQVEQKIVGLAEAVDEEDLARIRERINAEFAGRKLSRIDLGEAAGAAESNHPTAEGMAEVPGGEATF